jgi:uncharacterized protein YbaP (TraB family)
MNFRRILPAVAALAASALSLGAPNRPIQATAPDHAPAAAKQPVKGMFWRATNGTNTVYLLGSIHLASEAMYPLPKPIEDGFTNSKTLVVEVDLTKVDQSKVSSMVMEKGLYPDGDDLLKHISKDDAKKLQAFCDKNGFPMVGLQKMRPWVASITISFLPFLSAGMKPELGIDQYFMDKAKKAKKPIEQAESVDFQFNLLASASDAEALAALHRTLNGKDGAGADMAKQLQESWIQGDVPQLEKLLNAERDPSGLDKKLIEDRNPHMADVAEKYLKGPTPCFFVVGAAHLVGPQGVVALLKQRGYSVEQVLSP